MSQSDSLLPVTAHLAVPSVARVYDYLLGGTTNWEVDRLFADHVLDQFPVMRRIALMQRRFARRAVSYLCRQGVRQFVDIGAGVPGAGSTHEVANGMGSSFDARVLYVDNDPVAVAHTELLLDRGSDRRRHGVINADLRAPEDLWQQVGETELFDLAQPVAVLLLGVLHLQQLDAAGNEVGPDSVAKLRELAPLGSHIALAHVTHEGVPARTRAKLVGLKRLYDASGNGVACRSRAEIEALLGDLRVVPPGWTAASDWQADETEPADTDSWYGSPSKTVLWAGVGEKV